MTPFTYNGLPSRVIFGFGTLDKAQSEVTALGCARALILSTPEQAAAAQNLFERMGKCAVGIFCEAAMHTPVEVTERALAMVRDVQADCTIALGGGSTIGLGKAIAQRTDLPQIAIPTTYAGSEATPILGETRDGAKTTQRSPRILPEVIIYDVDLTLTLPPTLSATSGVNAIAHALEALYTQDANPITSLIAEEGIRALATALPRIITTPEDREARSDALYGAWCCGVCLGTAGMALHHKLCHILGGAFNLPHAETHAVLLPHVLAYNAIAAPQAMHRVARALGTTGAIEGLHALVLSLAVPLSLRSLGMPEAGLEKVADLAIEVPYWNPRKVEKAAVLALLENAYYGRQPVTT
jgi:alcohol dehydrogenase class IV